MPNDALSDFVTKWMASKMARKYPRLAWWLTRLAIVLLVGGSLAVYQWSRHVARMREDQAALGIDRELGMTVETIDDDIAADLDVPPRTTGLVVTSLADGRPADRAGVQAGDVIEQIDDLAVTGPESAMNALQADRDRRLAIIVNRHGRDLRLEVIRG